MLQRLKFRKVRIHLFIAAIFMFAGPLDYITTYYGIYIDRSVGEANPVARLAIENGLLFEYMMVGSIIITLLLLGTYKLAEQSAEKRTWKIFEISLSITFLLAAGIVINNIIILFYRV